MIAVAGTPRLLWVSLRHDGRLLVPWILLVTALSASSVIVYPLVFPDQQDRIALAAAVGGNPALGLIFGPALNLSTVDGFNAWRSLAIGGFLAALGAIFTVTRASRGQEDSGQAELLASGVLGRASRLLTAVGMAALGSLAVGIIAALVTVVFGGGWSASLALGGGFTATGWIFTGVAAVAAQLGSDARAANSMAVGSLGVLFLARGFLFSVEAPEWTAWINPLGWISETKPATDDNWWPLLAAVGLTVVLLAAALSLQARRDFGVGAIPPHPGPRRGWARSALGLTVRLNRGPIITWMIGFVALGTVFGYFTRSVTDILGRNAAVQHILAAGATTQKSLVNTFLVTILSLIGIIAAIPGVQTIVKVRSEEMDDRLDPVMATPTSRPRYYAANILVALTLPGIYMLIAGLIVASIAALADIGVNFGDAIAQTVVTVPAVWTVVAVAVFVIGARPQVALAAWVGVLASFALTVLGPTFQLPDWALAISPFWHVPTVTSNTPDWWGPAWITLVTILLLGVGTIAFRRRDIAR